MGLFHPGWDQNAVYPYLVSTMQKRLRNTDYSKGMCLPSAEYPVVIPGVAADMIPVP